MASPTDKVKLYYLGGFINEKAMVSAKGAAYAVPPIGGFLELPLFAAKDLIRRNRTPQGHSVFTTSAQQAQMALRASKNEAQESGVALTREQLLAELAKLDNASPDLDVDLTPLTRRNKAKTQGVNSND